MTDWLDELCEEYEAKWKRFDSGLPSRLRNFLAPWELARTQLSAAVPALAEIDVERDWIWWRKWLKREADRRTVAELLVEFARNTRLVHFHAAAKDLGVPESALANSHVVELRARSIWGDSPHRNEYSTTPRNMTSPPLPRHHATIQPTNGSFTKSYPLHGLTEFGRQRSQESSAEGAIFGPTINRIVLSGKENARYSRTQFRVQILSPEYAVVSNESLAHPLHFADGKQLLHQHSSTVRFPFQIHVVDLMIECT